MKTIDLNCDLGESFGLYTIGNDEAILDYVTSVNIACGFHGGDPLVMEKTVRMAIEKGVAIGAHPGFPDLLGFGRRNMAVSPKELKAYITYQVGALYAFVKANGGILQHVKPHGALYNMAAADYSMALAIAEAIAAFDKGLILMGLANSNLIKAADDVGIPRANEVFADRSYNMDGTLVSRNIEGALIHDEELCKARVVKMIKEGRVVSIEGAEISLKADSICIHGDNPLALSFACGLRERLQAENIILKALR
ncbi:5-oxoprolinase subunit PxpA [Alkaliphilus serpentinus]|uniref:5-oxoprolinase subunit A n=2 Tax=Alkaliphilus serpentinus TaxID=1482731 RepID=A0A833MEQ2_9FIRM|nr:5-oxoprolinase subunit PxpA [Alkaliphilus serpentinus]KAB3531609.1 5-oxoprolinase subunit PxpA [Alkaliphilus serpentinus]